MKLPRRALTDLDLKYYGKKLKISHFRGVYMKDNLPKQIKNEECGIVNMNSILGEGTHWTAYFKNSNHIIYFDSYGNLPPPPELIKYFLSDGSNVKIHYN